nr:piggyBac transposable element-derived protein 4-like isoform X2 [Styela clava]
MPSPRIWKRRPQGARTTSGAKRGRCTPSPRIRSSYKWTKSFIRRANKPFGGQRMVQNRQLNRTSTPLDCFFQFFNTAVLQFIVKMTNLNAVRKIQVAAVTKNIEEKEWKDVDVKEIKAFLGMIIAMGIIRLPNIHLYWQKKNWIFDVPSFNKIMPRDRFVEIHRYMHFCDEALAPRSDDPKKDKLFKIRGLLSLLLPLFESCYKPGQDLSIDESLIPFKGRISFRQFIKRKRARFGIKVWVLAESSTGYVSRLKIYVGREPTAGPETGLSSRVVKYLINPFEGLYHRLYVDNFYTSPELFEDLLSKGVFACGTFRSNSVVFPKDLIVTRVSAIPRGTSDWRVSNQLLAQSWVDNRVVYFLSTFHEPEYDPADTGKKTVKRKVRRGHLTDSIEIPCPPLLKDYNANMGGVDLSDQMRKYYNLTRRSRVWYRRIFSYLIEVAVHNARVVAENLSGRRWTGVDFRINLVTSLIGGHRASRRTSETALASLARLQNTGLHFPVATKTQKRCPVCYKKSQVASAEEKITVSRGTIKCTECNVNLCVRENKNCFRDWHTKIEYWR